MVKKQKGKCNTRLLTIVYCVFQREKNKIKTTRVFYCVCHCVFYTCMKGHLRRSKSKQEMFRFYVPDV